MTLKQENHQWRLLTIIAFTLELSLEGFKVHVCLQGITILYLGFCHVVCYA